VQPVLQQAVSEGYRGNPPEALIAGTIDEVAAGAGLVQCLALIASLTARCFGNYTAINSLRTLAFIPRHEKG